MKILYAASTWQHLLHFHIPYLKYLREQGHTVHVAAGGEPKPITEADRLIELPLQKRMASLKNFRAARSLAKIMDWEQYDLIAVHTSLAAFFVRLAARMCESDCPLCNTVHGYLFDAQSSFLKRTIMLWAEKLMASVTDTVVVMAQEDFEIAQKNKLYTRQLKFIRGMGVDFTRYPPVTLPARLEARQQLKYTSNDFLLVFAGEFSARKNQQMLIRAMAQLPLQVKLILLGNGAELPACRSMAAELGVSSRILFAGYQQNTSFYYAAADLCVSSSRSEGLPFNLMEAMGMGLPVVATAVKGHVDLVKPGKSGILVPYDDAERFSEAVVELMKNPSLREQMGGGNIEAMQEYSLSAVFPENIAIYEEMLHYWEQSAASHPTE